MNTRALALILAAATLTAPGPLQRILQGRRPPASCCPDNVVNQPNPAAVQVISYQGGGKCLGSGTLISSGRILSASHVFSARPTRIEVIFSDGTRVEAQISQRDSSLDLVILEIPPSDVTPCPIADASPDIGQPVTAGGHGDSREPFRVLRGKLKSNDGQTITLAGLARGGDSGGPILDAAGRLIGVVTRTSGGRTACQDQIIRGTGCQAIRRFLGRVIPSPDQGTIPPAPDPEPEPDDTAQDPILPWADISGTLDRIDAIEARLDALEAVEPAACDVDAILAELPGITFQPIARDGSPLGDSATRKLGETLKLRSYDVGAPR